MSTNFFHSTGFFSILPWYLFHSKSLLRGLSSGWKLYKYNFVSGAHRKCQHCPLPVRGHDREVQEEVRRVGGHAGQDGWQAGLQLLHRDGDTRRAGLRRVSPSQGNAHSLRG